MEGKQFILLLIALAVGIANAERDTTVECDMACPEIWSPVCASNNETYASNCTLEVAACISDCNLTFVHDGECEGGNFEDLVADVEEDRVVPNNDTEEQVYGLFEDETENNNYGQNLNHDEVGSNGNNAGDSDGDRTSQGSPDGRGRSGEKAQQDGQGSGGSPNGDNGRDSNVTPSNPCSLLCPMTFDPVCGTNGQTYSNSCLLNFSNCNLPSSMWTSVLHEGRCNKRFGTT